jgi:AraC-like DNA-binding protein
MDPADVEIVPAPDALRPFVRRYIYANRQLAAPLVVTPKPTGYIYFANLFGEAPADFVRVDGRKSALESRFHFAGQIVDHDIEVHHTERQQSLYCELAATAQHRLFGVPGDRTTGKAPALADVAPALEAMARAHFTLGPEGRRDEHVAEANAFFAALAERAAPADPLVEDAVALLEAANGGIRIVEICERLGTGPRQLNRRFRHVVGLNPKFFGQILQVNWVVGLLYFNDTATLTEIAHEAGFHDQSHFNRAMRRFFDEGPNDFLRSDHALLKTFLGESRRVGLTAASTG